MPLLCHLKQICRNAPRTLRKPQGAFVARVNSSKLHFPVSPIFVSVRTLQTSRLLSQNIPPNRSDNDDGKQENGNDQNNDPNKNWRNGLLAWTLSIATLYLGLVFLSRRTEQWQDQFVITWQEFIHELLAKGEVAEIVVRPEREKAIVVLQAGAIFKGNQVNRNFFILNITDGVDKFEEKLRDEEHKLGISAQDAVSVSYRNESSIAPLILYALIFGIGYLFLRNRLGAVRNFNPSQFLTQGMNKAKYTRVDTQTQLGKGIAFKDVAGLTEAKVEVAEFVDYLKNPLRYKELGARLPRGALLLGPPGCGKTLLARAVATESRVPFLAMAGSEFVEMLGGLGAARVRDLFKEAKRRKPCIVFIDEIDAIGRNRSGGDSATGNLEEEHTLNQLLVEMDGMSSIDAVIIFAATNRADTLDKALLRPGRFDRHILIDLPTLQERCELFLMYLKKIKLANETNISSFSERLAQLTPQMTGADIANVCNEAAIRAASLGLKAVESEHLDYAVAKVSAGMERKSTSVSPVDKKVIAYHEAGHAVMAWLLEHAPPLLKVSIIPRTSSVVGFSQYQPSEYKLFSKEQMFDQMCLAFGGRAAEAIIFNHTSTNAEDDLKNITKSAYDQIRKFGMNDTIGPLSFQITSPGEAEQRSPNEFSSFGNKPFSKMLSQKMDEEARNLVARAYHRTEEMLRESRENLKNVAEALLKRETLTFEDISSILGKPISKKVPLPPSSDSK